MSWNESKVNKFRNMYPVAGKQELEDEFGITMSGLKSRASRMGLKRKDKATLCAKVRDTEEPDISPEFGHFLAGFTAGEGYFGVRESGGNSKRFRFQIALSSVDEDILWEIKDRLGVGAINYHDRGVDEWEQSVMYSVQSIPENAGVIVPIFRKYPLRKTNKRRQFNEWCEEMDEYLGPLVEL